MSGTNFQHYVKHTYTKQHSVPGLWLRSLKWDHKRNKTWKNTWVRHRLARTDVCLVRFSLPNQSGMSISRDSFASCRAWAWSTPLYMAMPCPQKKRVSSPRSLFRCLPTNGDLFTYSFYSQLLKCQSTLLKYQSTCWVASPRVKVPVHLPLCQSTCHRASPRAIVPVHVP
jgi:hypothetical protein